MAWRSKADQQAMDDAVQHHVRTMRYLKFSQKAIDDCTVSFKNGWIAHEKWLIRKRKLSKTHGETP